MGRCPRKEIRERPLSSTPVSSKVNPKTDASSANCYTENVDAMQKRQQEACAPPLLYNSVVL